MCFFVVNKVKVYYGLLKEPDINIPIDDEDEGDDADKPKVWHIIEKALCWYRNALWQLVQYYCNSQKNSSKTPLNFTA